jgi:hypothetical protein
MKLAHQDRQQMQQLKQDSLHRLSRSSFAEERKSYFLHQLSSAQDQDSLEELATEMNRLDHFPKLKLVAADFESTIS